LINPWGFSMRFIVIGMFLLILFSLGSALYFLVNDKGNSDRTVKALTVRIALSLILFLLLMGSYYFGLIPSQGLR
jgi:hypothetical protein